MGPDISFVIPVRNDAARLSRCLKSIGANSPAGLLECVVADNGSTDASVDVARSLGAAVQSLPALKVSALRNRAAASAAGRILAFVDADHEIAPTWAAAALEAFHDPSVGAAGALYLPPASGTWTQRLYGVLRGRTTGRADTLWLGSGNLAVRREVFDRVGGFDETLETCEDVDLCQRIRAAGMRIVADERLLSVHHGDPKTLRELFLSERWRGRDNIRVSLRTRLTLRDLPSLLIPAIDALAILIAVTGLVFALLAASAALQVTLVSILVVVGLAVLRFAHMVVSRGLRSPGDLLGAFAVALTYDAGRALSLILPAGHRRRRAASTTADGGTA